MTIEDTKIEGAKLITPQVFGDSRGYFTESYQAERYAEVIGKDLTFVQDNRSFSSKGILRGLHFQKTRPQGKLVQCVLGSVYDVIVDIRLDSPTLGRWVGVHLDDKNHKQLWAPPGVAHGFLVTSEQALFEYKCTEYYAPHDEGAIRWDDPDLNIEWPQLEMEYRLSEKDLNAGSYANLMEK